LGRHPLLYTIILCAGVAVGALVAVLSHDVIIGVIVGAALAAVCTQIVKLWTGHSGPTSPSETPADWVTPRRR
jgi:MFS superfamily sulfate permease-like transporter